MLLKIPAKKKKKNYKKKKRVRDFFFFSLALGFSITPINFGLLALPIVISNFCNARNFRSNFFSLKNTVILTNNFLSSGLLSTSSAVSTDNYVRSIGVKDSKSYGSPFCSMKELASFTLQRQQWKHSGCLPSEET